MTGASMSWYCGEHGCNPQPLSLLRGNGDGTFTEVTKEAGLSGLMATQAAA